MIYKASEIKREVIDGKIIIMDEYIGCDFVMDFIKVRHCKAYEMLREIRERAKMEGIYIPRGKATLSGLYKLCGIKGNFE